MDEVIKFGDIRLHKETAIVDNFNENYSKLLNKMELLCNQTDAFGIAAPQLGIMEKIIYIKSEKDSNFYFNPHIIKMYGIQFYYESCISIENTIGLVKRPYLIEIEAEDEKGNYIHKMLEGMDAIIACHEIDHLNGILYVDRAIDVINNIDYNERIKVRKNNPRRVIDKTERFEYI